MVEQNQSHRYLLLQLTAKIVSAHVARNKIATDGLSRLINEIYAVLRDLNTRTADAAKLQPAVSIKRSVFPEYIICLEDGKKLKMLKRHLKSAYNLTPEEYREKWDLPPDYPMVASNYVRHRATMARSSGLGRTRGKKNRAGEIF